MPSDHCIQCGHNKISVISSRLNALSERVRRRLCDRCGARWNTIEVDANDIVAAQRTRDAVRTAMTALQAALDLLPVTEIAE